MFKLRPKFKSDVFKYESIEKNKIKLKAREWWNKICDNDENLKNCWYAVSLWRIPPNSNLDLDKLEWDDDIIIKSHFQQFIEFAKKSNINTILIYGYDDSKNKLYIFGTLLINKYYLKEKKNLVLGDLGTNKNFIFYLQKDIIKNYNSEYKIEIEDGITTTITDIDGSRGNILEPCDSYQREDASGYLFTLIKLSKYYDEIISKDKAIRENCINEIGKLLYSNMSILLLWPNKNDSTYDIDIGETYLYELIVQRMCARDNNLYKIIRRGYKVWCEFKFGSCFKFEYQFEELLKNNNFNVEKIPISQIQNEYNKNFILNSVKKLNSNFPQPKNVYKVNWFEVHDLVSTRDVIIEDGKALITYAHSKYWMSDRFDVAVEHWKKYDQDNIFKPLEDRYYQRFVEKYFFSCLGNQKKTWYIRYSNFVITYISPNFIIKNTKNNKKSDLTKLINTTIDSNTKNLYQKLKLNFIKDCVDRYFLYNFRLNYEKYHSFKEQRTNKCKEFWKPITSNKMKVSYLKPSVQDANIFSKIIFEKTVQSWQKSKQFILNNNQSNIYSNQNNSDNPSEISFLKEIQRNPTDDVIKDFGDIFPPCIINPIKKCLNQGTHLKNDQRVVIFKFFRALRVPLEYTQKFWYAMCKKDKLAKVIQSNYIEFSKNNILGHHPESLFKSRDKDENEHNFKGFTGCSNLAKKKDICPFTDIEDLGKRQQKCGLTMKLLPIKHHSPKTVFYANMRKHKRQLQLNQKYNSNNNNFKYHISNSSSSSSSSSSLSFSK